VTFDALALVIACVYVVCVCVNSSTEKSLGTLLTVCTIQKTDELAFKGSR